MSEVKTIINEKLPLQLDSVSWNKKHDLLAVGAYMIDPSDSTKRIGKIFLIKLSLENNENDEPLSRIMEEIDISGVLDLRWEPEEQNKLAIATSSSFELYELDVEQIHLNKVDSIDLKVMALYTQWMDASKLIFSDSEGNVNIVTANPLKLESSKKIHDTLTWVVQYSTQHGLVFAGNDEGKFTGFRLENLEDEEKHFTKKFQVGVTSIIFLVDNVLGVGSYDDTLRLFTVDCMDPICLSLKKKIELGGAVWRTVTLPVLPNFPEDQDSNNINERLIIAAACARNGIHLINLNYHTWTYDTISSCLEHEGFLAYGLDVKVDKESKTYVIASCYFDNQMLHVWKSSHT